jgi:hypothetical protein
MLPFASAVTQGVERIMSNERQPPDKNPAQCEITKRWLPAGEIVEIQGHEVFSAARETWFRI